LNFFFRFSAPDIAGAKCEKQSKIHFLWSLNCFFEFSVFLVSVLDVKNMLKLLKIVFKVIFLQLIHIGYKILDGMTGQKEKKGKIQTFRFEQM
jgi:hypothetical protein